jgi:hypothetical protein
MYYFIFYVLVTGLYTLTLGKDRKGVSLGVDLAVSFGIGWLLVPALVLSKLLRRF